MNSSISISLLFLPTYPCYSSLFRFQTESFFDISWGEPFFDRVNSKGSVAAGGFYHYIWAVEKKQIKKIGLSFLWLVLILVGYNTKATTVFNYIGDSVGQVQKPDSPSKWASLERIQIVSNSGVSLSKLPFEFSKSIQDLFENLLKRDEFSQTCGLFIYDLRYSLKIQIFPFHSFWWYARLTSIDVAPELNLCIRYFI